MKLSANLTLESFENYETWIRDGYLNKGSKGDVCVMIEFGQRKPMQPGLWQFPCHASQLIL